MPDIESFPPLSAESAQILLLGSMPGQVSLGAQEYYAHPRNAFWPIMGELVGALPALSYTDRCNILTTKGIAVWDVIKSCRRTSSLDSDIEQSSITINDFTDFFQKHPRINKVFFNGKTAELNFKRFVLPVLKDKTLILKGLSSTSPANAAITFQKKLDNWRIILQDDIC